MSEKIESFKSTDTETFKPLLSSEQKLSPDCITDSFRDEFAVRLRETVFNIEVPYKLVIYFIQPAQYDRNGNVIKFEKGYSIGSTLYQLDANVKNMGLEPDKIETHVINEQVQDINPDKIIKQGQEEGTQVVLAFTGQTSQISRAYLWVDYFREKAEKEKSNIVFWGGGPHVSVCQEEASKYFDAVFRGEAEGPLQEAIKDLFGGKMKRLYQYNFDGNIFDEKSPRPNLSETPFPDYSSEEIVSKYFSSRLVSIISNRPESPRLSLETSKGCPYGCDYCLVTRFAGRRMRSRPKEQTVKFIIDQIIKYNVREFFLSDDNFKARKDPKGFLRLLISSLREKGINPHDLDFMMQVDTKSWKKKGEEDTEFLELLKEVGVRRVFTGVESVIPENLQSVNKHHNNISEYKKMVEAYHKHGISVHTGYILGLPYDKRGCGAQAAQALYNIGFDQVTCYILTPFKGTPLYDSENMSGNILTGDWTAYDGNRSVLKHPNLSAEELLKEYEEFYDTFNSLKFRMARVFRDISEILNSTSVYWGIRRIATNYFTSLFARKAVIEEGLNPMAAGIKRRETSRTKEYNTTGKNIFIDPLPHPSSLQCR